MSEKLNQLPTDDLFLLDRFINGNDDAFTIIYNRYVNQLMAYGMGWGFDKETLKDAIQDVFYKLYFNRKAFQGVSGSSSNLVQNNGS